MHKRFFILGSNPALSLSEILSTLSPTIHTLHDEFCIVNETDRSAGSLQRFLGGSQKIGSIIGKYERKKDIFDDLENIIAQKVSELDLASRITFGASIYGRNDLSFVDKITHRTKGIVKTFSEKTPRYVANNTAALGAASLIHNNIFENGFEIIILAHGEKFFVGFTESVQDIEFLSKKDYNRPGRNTAKGMIPPKLARMMINLSGKNSGIFLDPFCGAGTILQEAIICGFSVHGSDISPDQIKNSRENLEWLKEDILEREVGFSLFLHDAKRPFPENLKGNVDLVVTEPFLGAQIIAPISMVEFSERKKLLSEIYIKAMRSLHPVLKSSGEVVIIFPRTATERGFRDLEITEKICKEGYQIVPVSETVRTHFKSHCSEHGILYRRPDQLVKRDIVRFRKLV